MLTPSLVVALAQAQTVWSPLPVLSFGGFVSVLCFAVGYGKLMQQVKQSLASSRRANARTRRVEKKVDTLATAVARIEGALGTTALLNHGIPPTPKGTILE